MGNCEVSITSTSSTRFHPANSIRGGDVIAAAPDRAASLQEQPILFDTRHINNRAAQHQDAQYPASVCLTAARPG